MRLFGHRILSFPFVELSVFVMSTWTQGGQNEQQMKILYLLLLLWKLMEEISKSKLKDFIYLFSEWMKLLVELVS